ncbi:hypothetical protein NE562_04640 [Butyricicoccus faecihominis]|uniref:hypothetical protein n=1 Tax=Butyricicoccus faecihominis TaxID=1712515 RepID=UPI002478E5EB|nr:hypothetical protein [Butyricicoccus faecihominis]MCQ5128937.1 hypothetical protein [Butyricicoccus faecihominis]
MANDIYILSACDAWAGRDSMRILCVTTDKMMLYASILAEITHGNMEYGGNAKNSSTRFLLDYLSGEVSMDKIKYGFVQTCPNAQMNDPESYDDTLGIGDAYEELINEKRIDAVASLSLDDRSLIYSTVEVRTDHDYACFLVPGICDRDALEQSDQYQEMMEEADETEVNVSVSAYSVGTGESESPDEDELKLIEQYEDEIGEEYGIDQILSDFFSFEYEPEEEY